MNKINFSFIELLVILSTFYLIEANDENNEIKGIIKLKPN